MCSTIDSGEKGYKLLEQFCSISWYYFLHCKVLLEGSIDVSYDANTSILDDVFKYIDSTKRFNPFQELIDTSIDTSKKYEKPDRRKKVLMSAFFSYLIWASVWLCQHG